MGDPILEENAMLLGHLSGELRLDPFAHYQQAQSGLHSVVRWSRAMGDYTDSSKVLADFASVERVAIRDHGINRTAAELLLRLVHARPSGTPGALDESLNKARSWCSYSRGQTPLRALHLGLLRGLRSGVNHDALRVAYVRRLVEIGYLPFPIWDVAPDVPFMDGSAAPLSDLDLADACLLAARSALGRVRTRSNRLWRMIGEDTVFRANGHQPEIILILGSRLALGGAELARLLGLSLRGVTKQLDLLIAHGAVVEVTGRRSHKVFALNLPDSVDLKAEHAHWLTTAVRGKRRASERLVRSLAPEPHVSSGPLRKLQPRKRPIASRAEPDNRANGAGSPSPHETSRPLEDAIAEIDAILERYPSSPSGA